MSLDKSSAGQPDRVRVSATEDYEARTIAEKFGLELDAARSAIHKYGPMRKTSKPRSRTRNKAAPLKAVRV